MKSTILTTSMLTLSIFGLLFSQSSCKKTTPPDPNEEELVTTFKIIFTDSAGTKPNVVAVYKDIDGDGGNNPSVFDTIKLQSNTTYNATILLLDESKTPADSISNEVLEEGNEHLFCFTPTNINTTIVRTDKDINNLEIGLRSKWITGAASNGTTQIVLRHQPDNTKNGSCNIGSSDVDLTFQTILY
jgi:hypothetical protein